MSKLRIFQVLISLVLLSALAPRCYTQALSKPIVQFGSVPIAVGMPQDVATLALSEAHRLSKARDGSDQWDVTTVTEPHYIEGFIEFRNGVVVRAARLWTSEQTGYSIVAVTTNILEKFKQEGFSKCVADSGRGASPDQSEKQTLNIDCGGKSIVVEALRWNDHHDSLENVMIWEIADVVFIPNPIVNPKAKAH